MEKATTAMLCAGENRIQIRNDGLIMRCSRPARATRPLEVPGGYIQFVDSINFWEAFGHQTQK